MKGQAISILRFSAGDELLAVAAGAAHIVATFGELPEAVDTMVPWKRPG